MIVRRRRAADQRPGVDRSARLPVIGLTVVVLMLSVFACAMAIAGKRATDQFTRSDRLSSAWRQTVDGLRDESLLIQQYRTHPVPGIRNNLNAAAADVQAAVDLLNAHDQNIGAVLRIDAAHRRYQRQIRRLLQAVDEDDTRMAARIYTDELQPLGSAMTYLAEQAVDRQNAVNAAHLRDLRRLQSIGMATPVVFAAGLLLLGLFWRVLHGYQRDIEQQARDQSDTLSALLVHDLGVPATAGRAAAMRQHLLDLPAPIVATALGYHHNTTTRLAAEAGTTWSNYPSGNHGP